MYKKCKHRITNVIFKSLYNYNSCWLNQKFNLILVSAIILCIVCINTFQLSFPVRSTNDLELARNSLVLRFLSFFFSFLVFYIFRNYNSRIFVWHDLYIFLDMSKLRNLILYIYVFPLIIFPSFILFCITFYSSNTFLYYISQNSELIPSTQTWLAN